MSRSLKPIPRNLVEVEQSTINPYIQDKPDSNEGTVFSRNRAKDISRKNDKIKDISVGLDDIDNAIQYYFDNIIKPNVIQNGVQITVPVIFGDAERWSSVQNNGFYRDKDGKLMVPLIMFKRTNVEKNRTLGNKLDGNKAHLFNVFGTRYNAKNQYDNFSILTNRIPSKQYYVSVVPDYVTITYECVLFTNFIEQNNKLIEAIEFASDSYWGDYSRWHFKAKIDSFAVTNTIEQGSDRAAKTSFTITLNGYLIPDSVNAKAAMPSNMFYSPAQIVFGLETVSDVNKNYIANSQIKANQVMGSTSFIGGGNNITISAPSYSSANPQDIIYIITNKTRIADIITIPNQATFTGGSFLQPSPSSGIPNTSKTSFSYFINGQYVSVNNIISFDGTTLIIDTANLGYELAADDEVVAIGKFA
jgi:hypothetical protein